MQQREALERRGLLQSQHCQASLWCAGSCCCNSSPKNGRILLLLQHLLLLLMHLLHLLLRLLLLLLGL
jgi:hypothetical protein